MNENIFLKSITDNEIHLTESMHEIEQILSNGIDINELINAISAGRAKPVVTLDYYSMKSSSKKGFYDVEVILLKNRHKLKGVARNIEGVVNSSVKAAQAAIGEGRFILSTSHPIEIRTAMELNR